MNCRQPMTEVRTKTNGSVPAVVTGKTPKKCVKTFPSPVCSGSIGNGGRRLQMQSRLITNQLGISTFVLSILLIPGRELS